MKLSNIPLLMLLMMFLYSCMVAKNKPFFTVYLVRHSEKELSEMDQSDPPLTSCGKERSESLSRFLNDVPIEIVYSTNYTRTINTALPTAKSKGLDIQNYDAESLESFSKQLIKRKQDALVVGHSNTTAVLAGILVGKEFGEFGLDIYDRIYQVTVRKKKGRLHVLHTAFECNKE